MSFIVSHEDTLFPDRDGNQVTLDGSFCWDFSSTIRKLISVLFSLYLPKTSDYSGFLTPGKKDVYEEVLLTILSNL